MSVDPRVTILIPTSPIPRHPDTSLVEECIDHVRAYLPDATLVIMADGVRPSVEHRRAQYREYVKRLVQLVTDGQFGSYARLIDFLEPHQQAMMTLQTLQSAVNTPLILFVEHDAMLRAQPRLNVDAIMQVLLDGDANVVRLYAWPKIWHEHEYLMRGEFDAYGEKFVKTVQYSQWPLFSTAEYHRKILSEYFTSGQRSMIETGMYGRVANSQWEDHKIVIYGPDGHAGFTHRDGRSDPTTGVRDPGEW